MNNKVIYFLIIVNFFSLYAADNHDNKISEELFYLYGDNITEDQIGKVLEYNPYNDKALYIKAKKLDNKTTSLFLALETLKKTSLSTVESKYHLISILYRLGYYRELLPVAEKLEINNIEDVNTLFYIADSFYRTDNLKESLDVINIARYKYPDHTLFYELNYLINRDKTSLRKIWFSNDVLQYLIRLQNRLPIDDRDSLVEVLIRYKLRFLDRNKLNNLKLNYNVINIISNELKGFELNGNFYLDSNSNTFPDSRALFENGKLSYITIDRDGDNLDDIQFMLKSGVLTNIIDKNIKLDYGLYPYVKSIEVGGNVKKKIIFYKNETVFEYEELYSEYESIDFNKIIKEGKLKRIEHLLNGKIYSKFVFLDNNTIKIYLEPNQNNTWDKLLLVKNGIVESGVRDLDSNGVYDLLEFYRENQLLEIEYNPEKVIFSNDIKEYYPLELPVLEVNRTEILEDNKKNIEENIRWWNQ